MNQLPDMLPPALSTCPHSVLCDPRLWVCLLLRPLDSRLLFYCRLNCCPSPSPSPHLINCYHTQTLLGSSGTRNVSGKYRYWGLYYSSLPNPPPQVTAAPAYLFGYGLHQLHQLGDTSNIQFSKTVQEGQTKKMGQN